MTSNSNTLIVAFCATLALCFIVQIVSSAETPPESPRSVSKGESGSKGVRTKAPKEKVATSITESGSDSSSSITGSVSATSNEERDDEPWVKKLPRQLRMKVRELEREDQQIITQAVKRYLESSMSPKDHILSTYTKRINNVLEQPLCSPESLVDLASILRELEQVQHPVLKTTMSIQLNNVASEYATKCLDQATRFLTDNEKYIHLAAWDWIQELEHYALEINLFHYIDRFDWDSYQGFLNPRLMASLETKLILHNHVGKEGFRNGVEGACSATVSGYDTVGKIYQELVRSYGAHPVVNEALLLNNRGVLKWLNLWTVCHNIRLNLAIPLKVEGENDAEEDDG